MLRRLQMAGLSLVAMALLIPGSTSPAKARAGQWDVIGSKAISLQNNRATIPVGRSAGRFSNVRLRVLGKSMFLRRMIVVFGNGDEQNIRVRNVIDAGDTTSSYRLDGNNGRFISEVRLRYAGGNSGGFRRSYVELLGQEAARVRRAPPPVPSGWLLMAREEVDLRGDSRHRINISRNIGSVNSIRIRSLDEPMDIFDARIVFRNGDVQRVRLNQSLVARRATRQIKLDGGARFIDYVAFRTRDGGRARRLSRIEIIGAEARRAPVLKPIPRGWKSLSVTNVDLRDDRFVLPVGRNKGPIKRINLRSRDEAVYIRNLRIIFGNGDTQRVTVNRRLRAGQEIGVVDLDGNQRFIREVVVRTKSQRRRIDTRLEMIGEEGSIRRPLPRGWKKLDEQRVDLRDDRFVLPVGRGEGRFGVIRLGTLDNDIFIRRMRITFGNGDVQTVRLNRRYRANSGTDEIDLDGGNRFIRKVVLDVDGINRRRFTRLELIGKKTRQPVNTGGWRDFGTQRAKMLRSSIALYPVGRGQGRFRKIRLRVYDHDVKIKFALVVYADGSTYNLPIRGTIRDGSETQPVNIDPKGRARRIQAIRVKHQTKINFKGPGSTQVLLAR